MNQVHYYCLLAFIHCALTARCLSEEPVKPEQPNTSAAAANVTAVTEADNPAPLAFAKKLETTLRSGDPSFLEAHLDYSAMGQTAAKGLELSAGFLAGFVDGFSKSVAISSRIVDAMKNGGKFKLLRVRVVNGELRALYRLLQGHGVNYHEYYLRARGDGDYAISDLYIYMIGEKVSATMRRALVPAAADQNRSLWDKLTGNESDYIKALGQIGEVQRLQKEEKYQEALNVYNSLPASVQHERSLMMIRLAIAKHVDKLNKDNSLYHATLDDFQKYFPNDPALDLLLLDAYYFDKDSSKLLSCLDRLEQSLGGDAYITYYRAMTYHSMKQDDKMVEFAQQAIAADRELPSPYYLLLQKSLDEKNYADTVKWLNALEHCANIVYLHMATQTLFADFVKSPEYQGWAAARNVK